MHEAVRQRWSRHDLARHSHLQGPLPHHTATRSAALALCPACCMIHGPPLGSLMLQVLLAAQDAAGNLSPTTSMLSSILTRAIAPPAFAALNLSVAAISEADSAFQLQLAAQLSLQANVSYAVYR